MKRTLEKWIFKILNTGHFNFYANEKNLGTVYFDKEKDQFVVEFKGETHYFNLIDETADFIRSLGEIRIVQES